MKNSIYLRRAEIKDAKFLWQLRNDKEVRRYFFECSAISHDKHLNWLRDKLASFNAYIFIVKNKQNKKIGCVRFERGENGAWKISIAIVPKFQRRGYGCMAIEMGCERLLGIVNVKKVVAYICEDNLASFNAFRKAGFAFKKDIRVKQRNAAIFEKINMK